MGKRGYLRRRLGFVTRQLGLAKGFEGGPPRPLSFCTVR
jgi:hypothetical protein